MKDTRSRDIPQDEIPEDMLPLVGLLEENDHVLATIGAATLERELDLLIEGFMVPDKREVRILLDRQQGNLGAKIRLAYCLGLITTLIRDDLRRVQAIRNEFAHSLLPVGFESVNIDKQIKKFKVVLRLRALKRVISSSDGPPTGDNQKTVATNREFFLRTVVVLAHDMHFRRMAPQEVGKKQRCSKAEDLSVLILSQFSSLY